jgi:hypothetical protein
MHVVPVVCCERGRRRRPAARGDRGAGSPGLLNTSVYLKGSTTPKSSRPCTPAACRSSQRVHRYGSDRLQKLTLLVARRGSTRCSTHAAPRLQGSRRRPVSPPRATLSPRTVHTLGSRWSMTRPLSRSRPLTRMRATTLSPASTKSSILKSTRSNASNQVTQASRNLLEPTPRTPVPPQSRDVLPFDVGVVQSAERLPVTPLLRLDHCTHNVRVFLRHRPSSIAFAVAFEWTRHFTGDLGS